MIPPRDEFRIQYYDCMVIRDPWFEEPTFYHHKATVEG